MWAIVPIKTFDRAKQRLSNVLSEEERRGLMLAMARDVITSLSSCKELSGILIVSRAREADSLATAFATERFSESPTASLAEALTQATLHLVANFNAEGVAVVPADVPGIEAEEIDRLIRSNPGITIMPDSDNIGTNGLICAPPLAIPYIFDGKSFKPHVDEAYSKNLSPKIVPASRFALDIDVPEDLLSVMQEAPKTQTATYLLRSGIEERLIDSLDRGARL